MRVALVVIDMQRGFLTEPTALYPSYRDATRIIEHAAAGFRELGNPVIWVQDHETLDVDDPRYEIVSELSPQPSDLRVAKVASNAFVEDGLPDALAAVRAEFVVLCGYRAEQCVLATARGAADRGLAHALLRDAVLSPDPDAARFVERIGPLASWEVVLALAAAGR